MKQCKTHTCRTRRNFISKAGIYDRVDSNAFYKSSKDTKSKSRATNNIMDSVLNVGYHKQQTLALNHSFAHLKVINQAANYGYLKRKS